MSLIEVGTQRVLAEVPVGERPWNMALTADGRKLYVANGRSGSVTVIDVTSRRPIAEIPVGEAPWGIAIS